MTDAQQDMREPAPPGPRARPLLGVAVAFATGTFCGLALDVEFLPPFAAAAACATLALLLGRASRRRPRAGTAAALLTHAAVALSAWSLVTVHPANPETGGLDFLAGERRVELLGRVDGDPDAGPRGARGAFSWRFPLEVDAVREGTNDWHAVRGTVRVVWFSGGMRGVPAYGERWRIGGKTRPPREGISRLRLGRVYASQRESARLAPADGRGLAARCYAARRAALRYLAAGIGDFPVETGIYQSLLLGYRWGLTAAAQELFASTGTIHIFAVSGSHVVIVAGLIIFVLRVFRISRNHWVLGMAPLLVAYTIGVGGASSAVRACLMAIVYFLAPLIGRRADVPTALAFAALLILGYAPDQLTDIGFICSFVVVIGLIVLCPLFDRPLRRWCAPDPFLAGPEGPWRRAGRTALLAFLRLAAASLAAWLTAAPLTAYFFGRFSLITLPCNLFVIPLSFLIILCGSLSMLLGPCVAVVGEVLNHAAFAMVWVLVRASELMAAIPGGATRLSPPPVWTVWLWYAGLAVLAAVWRSAAGAEAEKGSGADDEDPDQDRGGGAGVLVGDSASAVQGGRR